LKLTVVGPKDEIAHALSHRVQKEELESTVEMLGFIGDRSSLANIYQRAHVLASPALHEPGFSNVNAEAMASGCPVVATASGGPKEIILHGESGLIVPPDSVEATEEALRRILTNPQYRQVLSETARRVAVEHFSYERYIDRVLSAYENTMQRSRERRARVDQVQAQQNI
jgi:glycosyltransferase involved in cell wall biosynthesis